MHVTLSIPSGIESTCQKCSLWMSLTCQHCYCCYSPCTPFLSSVFQHWTSATSGTASQGGRHSLQRLPLPRVPGLHCPPDSPREAGQNHRPCTLTWANPPGDPQPLEGRASQMQGSCDSRTLLPPSTPARSPKSLAEDRGSKGVRFEEAHGLEITL